MTISHIIGIITSALGYFGTGVTVLSLIVKVKKGQTIDVTPRVLALLITSLALASLGLALLNNWSLPDGFFNNNNVSPSVVNISFDQENIIYMEEGTEKVLSLDAPLNGDDNPIIQWLSWNPDIVDVNGSGKNGTAYTATPVFAGTTYTIRAVGTGAAKVDVYYEDFVAECIVVVTTEKLQLASGPFAQTVVGGSFVVYIAPFYLGDCDDLQWVSRDTSVATVYDSGFLDLNTRVGLKSTRVGTVYAVGPGITTITVSCDGQSASFELLVEEG